MDGTLGGFTFGSRVNPADEASELEELRERMEGMPGSLPIDKEIREQRVRGSEGGAYDMGEGKLLLQQPQA